VPRWCCAIFGATQRGAAWGEDGNIIVTLSGEAALAGSYDGRPATATNGSTKTGPSEPSLPQILPGGEPCFSPLTKPAWDSMTLKFVALTLKTGVGRLSARWLCGRVIACGHLVYIHEGVLFGCFALPASPRNPGSPVPLLEDVAPNSISAVGSSTLK